MHKMWDDIWVILSEKIWRKRISIYWRNKIEIVDATCQFPLMLSLFSSNVIHIFNENHYEWIIELFENFSDPLMLVINFGFSRDIKWDTNISISNYREWMKESSFDHSKLYNRVVDVAIKRDIKLERIATFVFVHEIPNLKNIKFIRSILFPWNEENEANSMIKIWKEFSESKTFNYKEVRLIWDGMDIKSFMKIFTTVLHQSNDIKIIAKKDLQYLINFWREFISTKSNNIFFKMAENDEWILWNLQRSSSLAKLRKWYYKIESCEGYAIELLNTFIKFSSKNIIDKSSKAFITLDNLTYISFELTKIDVSNWTEIKHNNLIRFEKNKIEFNSRIIKYWESIKNKDDEWIYIFQNMIPITWNVKVKFNYSYNDKKLMIRFWGDTLNKDEIKNLIEVIDGLGYIYSILFHVEFPSVAIIFLNHWKEISHLKSIMIYIREKINIEQNYELRRVVSALSKQSKRVSIFKSSFVQCNYSSNK